MWALVALSAVGGALSGAEPAGWLPADILWRAGFAALVAGSTAKAHRWTWVVLAAVAAASAPRGWLLAAGLVGLGVAIAACVPHRRSRPAGALVGAIAVQVLLRVDLDGAGVSALVVAAAVAPVFVSAYVRSSRRARRRIVIIGLAGGGLAVVAAAGLAYAAVQTQRQLRDAADEVRDGLDAVRDNEPERAVALLSAADGGLRGRAAHAGHLGPPGPHRPRARSPGARRRRGGRRGVRAGRRPPVEATVEANTDDLRFEDGAIDLDLVAGFEGPLDDAYRALARASDRVDEARTMWLVDPLAGGVADFADEVDRALPDAELAIQGVRLASGLFGGEGERHYYIAFTQPAEARGLGGFVGNFGELTAIDGDVELTRSGRIRELIAAPGAADRTLSGPADYLARYGRFHPAQFLQDNTISPDGPSVGQVMAELYPQAGGQEVDGVIIVDPVALAALMNFTGPIPVEGLAEPLTADNAADFLIRQQYLTFQEDEQERIDFLDEASEATFERLTQGDLPGPQQVADVLGPVVDQGRLIVYSVHDDEQALMERVGLDGALPPVEGDFVSLTTQNSGEQQDRHVPRAHARLPRHLGPGHRSGGGHGHGRALQRGPGLGPPRHRDRKQRRPESALGHEPGLRLAVLRPAADRGRGRRVSPRHRVSAGAGPVGLLPRGGDPARRAGHAALPPRGRHPRGPDLSTGLRAPAAGESRPGPSPGPGCRRGG